MSDRLIFSRDASLYRIVPSSVVRPRNTNDVRSVIEYCRSTNQHLTFRAGGTSLSGQAVTDGILVDLSRNWDYINVLDDGMKVCLGPGITGGRVNGLLSRYGRKIGPDPASLIAAMVGGIVANNASGMCCGISHNTYHTMDSMVFMLHDGVSIDSSDPQASDKLRSLSPGIYHGITRLRDEVRNNTELLHLIRRKYLIKNTVGYSLNALLDEDEPARIIAKLMVGSEGTLGFIESVTYNTISEARQKFTQLFVYEDVHTACNYVSFWRNAGAAAVELMDDASLQSFAHLPTTPDSLRFTDRGVAALLVEFHDAMPPDIIPPSINREMANGWVTDAREQATLWHLRKGLMPSIGAMRPDGATMINEDVAVPPQHLADLVTDLKNLFLRHGFLSTVIFGHAKDGNMHFALNHRFDTEREVQRYRHFMDDLSAIVVGRYNGSLKAEHGTGRNIAPFVETEWGSTAYGVMQRVKRILDPDNVFNRGVLLNSDSTIHLKNIKPFPKVEPEIDKCIECGFCEHVCPTRLTTTTPRQRIVLRREIQLADTDELRLALTSIERDESIDSCAVDSMCSVVCPVGIDTGQFVRQQRSLRHGAIVSNLANIMASGYRYLSPLIKTAIGIRYNPGWTEERRKDENAVTSNEANTDLSDIPHRVVMSYLKACPSRWYASTDVSVEILAKRANIHLIPLNPMSAYCCGQPFASKGFTEASQRLAQRTVSASTGIIFTDTSTCGAALMSAEGLTDATIISPVSWIRDYVLPRINVKKVYNVLAIHPGCGVYKAHEADDLVSICQHIAHTVIVPPSAYCCGMAGNHGLANKDIPQSVLAQEKFDLEQMQHIDAFVSLNTICQEAITQQTGITCRSLYGVILDASRQ
ncbi:MAG: FAD-binding protein [Ignavibacteria bacterium]|nr:FAD-binding protein [Ignavibacteria bacterium]